MRIESKRRVEGVLWTLILALLVLPGCGEGVIAPGEVESRGAAPSGFESPVSPVLKATVPSTFCLLLDEESLQEQDSVLQSHGLTLVRAYGSGRLVQVEGTPDVVALEADSRVESFQVDGFTVLSSPVEITQSFFEGFWEDDLPTQEAMDALQLSKVHQRTQGRGVRVAVLDTGIDPSHSFFAGRIDPVVGSLGWIDEALGVDTDGDGRVDEAHGHGTHVAGIIAMVAPGATLIPIRVLDSDGVGSAFELAIGLYEAQAAGAQIANLSLVLEGESDVVEVVLREVTAAGMVVVGAAGNAPGHSWFPASDSHVLSVAAVDASGQLASFSASDDVRVAAPGVSILSAFPGDHSAVASGTSMASAVVSGAMAALTEITRSPNRSEEALRITAMSMAGSEVDDGSIQLLAAIQLLTSRRTHVEVRDATP